MKSRIYWTIATLGVLLTFHEEVHAIYLCYDKEGREVLTDRPTQLEQCKLLDLIQPALPEGRIAPASPPPIAAEPPQPRHEVIDGEEAGMRHQTVTIPIKQVGHLFVATVKFNEEQDALLIVDTGASHTIISHRLSSDLGMLSDSSLGRVTLNTVGGSVYASLVRMKSIRLADVEIKNSVVVIHDLPDSPPGVEGLLGLSTLQQFQVTLDPTNKTLSLRSVSK